MNRTSTLQRSTSHPKSVSTRMDEAQISAQRAALERLLNAFIRESGKPLAELPGSAYPSLPMELVATQRRLFWLPLASRQGILGTLATYSPMGLHHYGPAFWTLDGSVWRAATPLEISEILLAHLGDSSEESQSRRLILQEEILNSVEKTSRYLRYSGIRRDSERRLLFGHPFHPTPKSSEGFSPSDLARYAPELGATFQLEYLAISPQLLQQSSLPAHLLPIAGRLPCHPWQAAYLRSQPWVQELVAAQKLRFLGPQGGQAHPTSSVRTVRLGDWYLKLPLNVRITNYHRLNPADHLRRSLDVGRAIAAGPAPAAQAVSTVLLESGWRSLRIPDALAAHCAVLFRQTPPQGTDGPLVMASLLECDPDGGALPLKAILTQADATPQQWLGAYLKLALPAVLGWWVERGVSLEAHVQNTMVSLRDGWPNHLYLRDLEGGSLWAEHPQACWRGAAVDFDSPALYQEGKAWHRLLYYFFVNHLGHLISTLAAAAPQACHEGMLWAQVRRSLQALPVTGQWSQKELLATYLEELLTRPFLPAKANLLSRFQDRSEEPLYVDIPNPLLAVK